jgi:hypothetical protein
MVGAVSGASDIVTDLDCGLAAGAASLPCALTENGFGGPTLVRTEAGYVPTYPTTIASFGFVGCTAAGGGASYGSGDVCTGSLTLTYQSDTVPAGAATTCQRTCGMGSYTLTVGKSAAYGAFLTPLVANAGADCVCAPLM